MFNGELFLIPLTEEEPLCYGWLWKNGLSVLLIISAFLELL